MMGGVEAPRPRVLLTRPKHDSEKTAIHVDAIGADVILSPVIVIEEIAFEMPNLDVYDAFVFTSAAALRVFAKKSTVRDKKLFCVGENTANEAKILGFNDVFSANNDAESLFNLICDQNMGKFMYFAPETPSFALVDRLATCDVRCDHVVLYRSAPVMGLAPEAMAALWDGEIDYALFYSQKSALHFMELAEKFDVLHTLNSIKALCLSDGVLQSIRPERWKSCCVSAISNGSGMMDLLTREMGLVISKT